ncbi:hypothetical protein [Lentibacter sp.]|uniref:hypothetical protein n=1 Tax=Lentibacter sp. TaxID=2024994 RepID=UPI003F6B4FBD
MLYPSLPFLACLAVPLIGLWLARRGVRVSRLFLGLAALMGATALLIYAADALLSTAAQRAWPYSSVLALTDGSQSRVTSVVRITPGFVAFNAALLALCGVLYILQERFRAAFYSPFTCWLAAPLATFAATTEPMSFAIAYFAGFYDWTFARAVDKSFIIATTLGFTLTAVAIAGFTLQFAVSVLRALNGQRSA